MAGKQESKTKLSIAKANVFAWRERKSKSRIKKGIRGVKEEQVAEKHAKKRQKGWIGVNIDAKWQDFDINKKKLNLMRIKTEEKNEWN
jgi:hypothetical protein